MSFLKGLTHGTISDIKSAAHNPMSDESFAVLNRLNPITSMAKYSGDVGNKYLGTPTISHSDMGKATSAVAAALLTAGGGGAGAGGASGSGSAAGGSSLGGLEVGSGGAWGGPASTTGVNAAPSTGATLAGALKTGGSALGTMNMLHSLFAPPPLSRASMPQGGIQSNKQNGRLVRR